MFKPWALFTVRANPAANGNWRRVIRVPSFRLSLGRMGTHVGWPGPQCAVIGNPWGCELASQHARPEQDMVRPRPPTRQSLSVSWCTSCALCVGCFFGSQNQAHATIPKQPNVGGRGVASEDVRTMNNPATQKELSANKKATMQDG